MTITRLLDRQELCMFRFRLHVHPHSAFPALTPSDLIYSQTPAITSDADLVSVLIRKQDILRKEIESSVRKHLNDRLSISDLEFRKGSVTLFFLVYAFANYKDIKDGIEEVISDVKLLLRSLAPNTSISAYVRMHGIRRYLELIRERKQRFWRVALIGCVVLVLSIGAWLEFFSSGNNDIIRVLDHQNQVLIDIKRILEQQSTK